VKGAEDFSEAFARCPLVAILRGITPAEAEAVCDALVDQGFTLIEVPLNSPEPLDSIARLARRYGRRAVVGAGTVLNVEQLHAAQAAGARMIVSPNTDSRVISRTTALGLTSLPGYCTVSEAFEAIEAGAHCLKLFPAEAMTPSALRAQLAVIPSSIPILPVGGITPASFAGWIAAGAAGFGLGSALYRPGLSAGEVASRAAQMVAGLKAAH
jgi:2-dehydro-3-deoxyphosphogalactonate aldolase